MKQMPIFGTKEDFVAHLLAWRRDADLLGIDSKESHYAHRPSTESVTFVQERLKLEDF